MFQQGHHIVVVVETGDLPIPDLHDLAEPQFARAPRGWISARGQRQWTGVGPPPSTLKDGLILCGKRIAQLCPAIRKGLYEKQH